MFKTEEKLSELITWVKTTTRESGQHVLGHYSTVGEYIVLTLLKGITKAGVLESRIFLPN